MIQKMKHGSICCIDIFRCQCRVQLNYHGLIPFPFWELFSHHVGVFPILWAKHTALNRSCDCFCLWHVICLLYRFRQQKALSGISLRADYCYHKNNIGLYYILLRLILVGQVARLNENFLFFIFYFLSLFFEKVGYLSYFFKIFNRNMRFTRQIIVYTLKFNLSGLTHS